MQSLSRTCLSNSIVLENLSNFSSARYSPKYNRGRTTRWPMGDISNHGITSQGSLFTQHAPHPGTKEHVHTHSECYVDQKASAKHFDSLVGVLSLDDFLVWRLETLATPVYGIMMYLSHQQQCCIPYYLNY